MTGNGCGDHEHDLPSPGCAAVAAEMRKVARDTARAQARMLRLVGRLAAAAEAEARHLLALGPHVSGQPGDDEVVRTAIANEVQVVLGLSEWSARELVDLADRLTRVLPETLDALEDCRLDLPRVKVLVRATEDLSDELARAVQDLLLPGAGEAPWEGPSPRAWRQRVDRAVVRVDAEAARMRRERAVRDRLVRSWLSGDGGAELLIATSAEDIAMAETVITDLAHAWPAAGPDGERLSMDQRRVDALMDLFRRVRDGHDLPALPVRRQREIGLVLGADTLFPGSSERTERSVEGPGDPGEIRGHGRSVPVDPVSAAEIARAELAGGVAMNVLLVDDAGSLQRVVRLPRAPAGGWTRDLVVRAVRAALPHLPELTTSGYVPSTAIEDHVRARHPRCVWYDCPRGSSRCDLDHDEPWPRGPTDEKNLLPRCRRNHESKTRRILRTRVEPDGVVVTTMLTGLVVTTRPEPLPGFGAGETYGPGRRSAQPLGEHLIGVLAG
jgi:hypothetical protein